MSDLDGWIIALEGVAIELLSVENICVSEVIAELVRKKEEEKAKVDEGITSMVENMKKE